MSKEDLMRMCRYSATYRGSVVITPDVEHQLQQDSFVIAAELLRRLEAENPTCYTRTASGACYES